MTWLANTCVLLSLASVACIEFDSAAERAKDAGAPSEGGLDREAGSGMDAARGGRNDDDGGQEAGATDGGPREGMDSGPSLTFPAPTQPGDLVITEIMYDPILPEDSVAEWFEAYNATDQTLSLEGCLLKDSGQDRFTMPANWIIAPKAYATFARSAMAGFTPTFIVTSGFFLSNIEDEVEIDCASTVIDRVAYNEVAAFGSPAGASLSLSATRLSATDNDQSDAWCAASTPLGADFGSPGVANPVCNAQLDCSITACVHGVCADVAGLKRCDCTGTGYIGALCDVDINECAANTDNCDDAPDACQNTSGSFTCACPLGQTGTGVGTLGCCSPQSVQVCGDGDVYWADSCGQLGEKAQECGGDSCDAAKCNGGCPSGMAPIVGSTVCIDRYENSVWSSASCTGTQYQELSAISGFPLNVASAGVSGTVSLGGQSVSTVAPAFELYGCSLAGRIPANNASPLQAKRMCEASGKRICSPGEWLSACAGPANNPYPYGSLVSATACNTSEQGAGAVANTGSYPNCQGGVPNVFDMLGNVREIVGCSASFCPNGSGSFNEASTEWTCAGAAGSPPNTSVGGFRCCKDSP